VSQKLLFLFQTEEKINNLIPVISRSPKPSLPPPKAYEPPEPPSQRELGPPPPGYGRYADFDRGAAAGGPSHGPGPTGPRRNLDEVLCFKVRRGHLRVLYVTLDETC